MTAESHRKHDSVELVLQQCLNYPLVKEVLWSLQNTGSWHLADTQYTGLRIEFQFFLLKLVIMSMFIIQNFNISINFNKPCLKKKVEVCCCSLGVTLRRWFWGREGLVGNTAIKPFLCSSQLYCEVLWNVKYRFSCLASCSSVRSVLNFGIPMAYI